MRRLALLCFVGSLQAAHQAPVQIVEPAPFLRLDSRAEAWRLSRGTQAADWRLLDAQGRRIPFARLPDEALPNSAPPWQALALFPLPPAPPASGAKPNRQPGPPAGVMIDLGSHKPEQVERLRLEWSEAAGSFQAGYRLQTSADLQHWQPLGSGQLLSLSAADGSRLQQRELPLAGAPQRYLRLLWDEAGPAPRPSAASLLLRAPSAGVRTPTATEALPLSGPDADGALLIDLRGPQRLRSFRLVADQGSWVLAMRLQARPDPRSPWQELAQPLLYRVERGERVDQAPALALDLTASQLRLLPPAGAALPATSSLRAELTLQLPAFVWAAQGQAPYRLEVDSQAADAGPSRLQDVLPAGIDTPLGRAELGPFSVVAAAPEPSALRRQAPLWILLGLGALGLGWASLRLLRQGHADPASPPREDPGP